MKSQTGSSQTTGSRNAWALHGFLGRPADWDRVINEFEAMARVRQQGGRLNWKTINLWDEEKLSPRIPLAKWGTAFNAYVRESGSAGARVLLGYSMGGRLALEAFKDDPEYWEKVIIVSSHPGLEKIVDKESRQVFDQAWAQRWKACRDPEIFRETLAEWNRQAVFDRSKAEPLRYFADYSGEKLSEATVNWSLAHQQDFRIWLRQNPQFVGKIRWLVGEYDKKYCEMIRNLKSEFPEISVQVVPDAGHRILFDNPYAVAESVFEQLE